MIEEFRKALQEILVPDLKEIVRKLDRLEGIERKLEEFTKGFYVALQGLDGKIDGAKQGLTEKLDDAQKGLTKKIDGVMQHLTEVKTEIREIKAAVKKR